jgi:hypothetical protein
MSRSIAVWYKCASGEDVDVDVGHNDLSGCQEPSMEFWRLPIHTALGVQRLAELGILDPVWFKGWDDLAVLEKEVAALEAHIDSIPFHAELKSRWIRNLRICLDLLKKEAPSDSVPEFMIG